MHTTFLFSALSSLFKPKDDGVLAFLLSRPPVLSDLFQNNNYNVKNFRISKTKQKRLNLFLL